MNYYNKYIKYKNKYLQLKNSGGNEIPSFELYPYDLNDIKIKKLIPGLYKITLKSNKKYYNNDLKIILDKNGIDRLKILIKDKERIIYQTKKQKDKNKKLISDAKSKIPISKIIKDFEKSVMYYSVPKQVFKKYKENADLYSDVFKIKYDIYSFTKMFPDYLFLFQKIIEADRQEFIDFCKEVHKINIDRDEIKIITPGDINDLKLNNKLVINGVEILFNSDNLYGRFNTFNKLKENSLISDKIKLIYQFKEMLKDYSMSYKLDFKTRKKLFNWGFKPTDVFYHFMIFFQELHRIKELSEDSKKNSSIIGIKIKKENRQYLIKNIDNIREYFFKEYSKDFEDKTELLDNMYLIDYIIYKMDVVYNDIIGKLITGGVYRYIMSIIVGFKKLKNLSIFEDYLDKIKSSKIKNKDDDGWETVSKKGENDFTTNAKLFVDNVCPMELKISVNQISPYFFNSKCLFFDYKNININNDFVSKIKNDFNVKFLKNETKYEYDITHEMKIYYYNIISKITELKLDYRPLILGLTSNYELFKFCGEKFLAGPWFIDLSKFNKKLAWNITLNKWMISCLLKRKQDIKCIIVHRNNEDDKRRIKMITDFDEKYEKKLIAVFPRFNKREEKLDLKMKNFIGSMIFNDNGNKKYIFMFNNKGNIVYYNFRASIMYPKNIVIESLNLTYIELTTLIYFKEDMGVDLYFYLYKYNKGDDNIIILVKGNKLTEESKDYIEVELGIDRSKNNIVSISFIYR